MLLAKKKIIRTIGGIVNRFIQRVLNDSGTFENQTCLENEISSLGAFVDDFTYLLTANAYKANEIYAMKPENGNGDLAFSRTSVASRYNQNTNVDGVLTGISRINKRPHFQCPNLFLEKDASTNHLLYSEDISNAVWSKRQMTVTSDDITSPGEGEDSDGIYETIDNNAHYIYQSITKAASSLDYTASFFVKPNGRDWLIIQLANGANGVRQYYNISDNVAGTIEEYGSGFSYVKTKTEELNDGWLRISLTVNSDTTSSLFSTLQITTDDGYNGYYGGDIAKGFYLWGCQLEQNLEVSSYITTISSSVTRASEAITTKTGISSYIGQGSGTIYFRGKIPLDGFDKRISLTDGTSGKRILFIFTTTGSIRVYISNTTPQFDHTWDGIIQSGSEIRIALAYTLNDTKLFVNGSEVYSSSSVSPPSGLDRLAFTDGGNNWYGKIKIFGLATTRFSDANCVTLTDIKEIPPIIKDVIPLTFQGSNDYYAFGNIVPTSSSELIYIMRRGSDHNNGVDLSAMDYDIDSNLWSLPRQVAVTGDAYDYSSPSSGAIGSNLFLFVAKYYVPTDTFVDFGYIKSTDLNGTSWGSYISLSSLLTYERYNAYGKVLESTTSGKYFATWYEHKSFGTDPWRVNILKTINSGTSWTNINVYDGFTKLGESSLLHITGITYIMLSRNAATFKLYLSYSTDDCETWTNVGDTNLGVGINNCIVDTILVDGLIQVVYQDRGTGYIMISKDTTYTNAIALNFNTPTKYHYTGIDDVYNGLGYPSIVQLDGTVLYLNWAKESSTSEAHMYGTMCDLDDI